jgi:hypothetical protein
VRAYFASGKAAGPRQYKGKGKGGFLTSTVGGEPPGEDVYKFKNGRHPLSGHSVGRGIFALQCVCYLRFFLCCCVVCVVCACCISSCILGKKNKRLRKMGGWVKIYKTKGMFIHHDAGRARARVTSLRKVNSRIERFSRARSYLQATVLPRLIENPCTEWDSNPRVLAQKPTQGTV